MPEANRLIPALHRICSPFAALTDGKAWLAAEWEMPRKRQYSVVFDTPDRQFKSGGHLLAFWFPAVGEAFLQYGPPFRGRAGDVPQSVGDARHEYGI